jgi:dTMP kinase
LLLFCAARAQLIEEVIHPALERDATVICDRYSDSSIAYQGGGRGLGADYVRQLCNATTGGLWPELTILLWVEPEAALRRTQGDDRFEAEGIEFQRRVAAAYREIAEQEPGRVRLIDAEGSVDEVHKAVMAELAKVTA